MLDPIQVFVVDISSLKSNLSDPHLGSILNTSAILRRLFIDSGTPLIQKVASHFGYKPMFTLRGREVEKDTEEAFFKIVRSSQFYKTELNPANVPGCPTREIKLNKFLSTYVALFMGQPITVRDIITYVANVSGGVHVGDPKSKPALETIHSNPKLYSARGMPYPLGTLLDISEITIASLQDLYEISSKSVLGK